MKFENCQINTLFIASKTTYIEKFHSLLLLFNFYSCFCFFENFICRSIIYIDEFKKKMFKFNNIIILLVILSIIIFEMIQVKITVKKFLKDLLFNKKEIFKIDVCN